MTINTDTSLSFAAVGLWHKAFAHFGREFASAELLTIHPDPDAWGPHNTYHDFSAPLDELQAIGYVQTDDGGMTFTLHYSVEEHRSGCWECLGHVRPGTYCAGCGLTNGEEENGYGEGTRKCPD